MQAEDQGRRRVSRMRMRAVKWIAAREVAEHDVLGVQMNSRS